MPRRSKRIARTQTAGEEGSTLPSAVVHRERSETSFGSLLAEKRRNKEPLTTDDILHIVKEVMDALPQPANLHESSSSSGAGSMNRPPDPLPTDATCCEFNLLIEFGPREFPLIYSSSRFTSHHTC